MASKGSAEMLSVVPRVCDVPYGENTCVFMLHFGMNYSAVGHGFSAKEQVSFNFMATITICSDFGAPQNKVINKIKSATVSTVSPSISHEVMGPDAMIFVF